MKLSISLGAVLIGALLAAVPATAGNMKTGANELPFPRSERAQSVWAGGACWSECGSYCAWAFAGCLKQDAQGHCLKLTDNCDRYCQRQCRTQGGPLLPVELPWD